jgi:hypothetical protein
MADKIKAGTILIKEGALLPESLRVEGEPYTKGWRLVTNLGGYELDQRISKAGWTFFSMASGAHATGFSFNRPKALCRAVRRAAASLKSERFNCLEITRVATTHRFLGLTCVSVNAYPRHIREAPWAEDFAQWERGEAAVACAKA